MRKDTLRNLSIVLAVIALAISAYLTINHYFPSVPVVCSDSGLVNCANVLTSQYSSILGIPVAVLGVVFFIAELVVIFLKNNDAFVVLSGIGIAFVAYYIFSEFAVESICIYCTAVHVCTIGLFIISIVQEKKKS